MGRQPRVAGRDMCSALSRGRGGHREARGLNPSRIAAAHSAPPSSDGVMQQGGAGLVLVAAVLQHDRGDGEQV